MMDDLLDKAFYISIAVYEGPQDESQEACAAHSMRVAYNCETKEQKIVALLYDTIKKAAIDPECLISEGFPSFIIDAILSITQQNEESYSEFIFRAKQNPIGRRVKINDILDQMNLVKLETITEANIEKLHKHIEALHVLI
ncbi:MAG: GTP pyrophosphokinase [Bacteroidaceae bacterium]